MKPITLAILGILVAAPAAAQPVNDGSCPYASDPNLASFCDTLNDAVTNGDPCGGPVALADVLELAQTSPEHRAMAAGLLKRLAAETGRTLTDEEVGGLIADPTAAARILTVGIPQVVEGLRRAQGAADARGGSGPSAAPEYKLPSGVDLADAAGYFDATREGPAPIADGILRGDQPSDLPHEQVKTHRALSEILNRLSRNNGVASTDRFRVTYRGHSYSTADGLLAALARNGNTVTATVNQGVANFIDLYVAHPSGALCEVMTPVMIKTGYTAPDGSEITVPAVHSGLRFDVRGPDLNASVSFYQGVSGTGFFPSGLGKDQSWVGGHDVETITGSDVIKAAGAAALWRDAVEEIAAQDGLIGGGYGQTGVCNDSVALIQMLVTGRTTIYPLAMDDERVVRFLDAKIAEGGSLAARYRAIKRAVEKLPVDTEADPSQPARILESIPFGPGANPYYPGIDAAREALGGGNG